MLLFSLGGGGGGGGGGGIYDISGEHIHKVGAPDIMRHETCMYM